MALQELVTSEGWQRFVQHVDDVWGAGAQLAKIDRAFQELQPGDEAGERMTALQVRAAAKSVQALVAWPRERLRELLSKKKPGPFAGLRRIGR